MKEFTVGTVIMPEVPSDLLPMTQNFEDMLDTIDRRGITAEYSRLGRTLDLGTAPCWSSWLRCMMIILI